MVLKMLVYMRTRDGSQNVDLHEKKMALKMLFCLKTRDGSQNVVLHENKRWLSECWLR